MARLVGLRQLQHFLALADLGSFSRAADQVHLTQSALSRSIKLLEDELGARLVDRLGRGSELTPLGEAVAARARRLVMDAGDLRHDIAELIAGEAGTIRVGLAGGASAILTGPLLTHVARSHPRLTVVLSRGPVALQLRQLRQRELDGVVVDLFNLAPASDLTIEESAEMRVGFVCNAYHPLASKGGTGVTFEALLGFPVASYPLLSRELAYALTRQFGPGANPDEFVRLRSEDVSGLLDTVRQTDAIYFGILAPAMPMVAEGALAELATAPVFDATVRYALVTMAGRSESPSMQIFRRFFMARMRDIVAVKDPLSKGTGKRAVRIPTPPLAP